MNFADRSMKKSDFRRCNEIHFKSLIFQTLFKDIINKRFSPAGLQ